ncbi:MAG: amidohydrolase family protein [Mycobacterium sp.]
MEDTQVHVTDARVRLPDELRPPPVGDRDPLSHSEYDRVLDLGNKTAAGTVHSLLAQMDAARVSDAVLHAETETPAPAAELNDAVLKLVHEYPDRFTGVGTIDMPPARPGVAAREVDRIAADGLVGVNIEPAFFGLDIDDRWLYPTYARAEEHGLVVNLHTGVNYARNAPMRHERAELLDQVACDFPDLRIVACHGGWPQVDEFVAVARRHPTVYLELGGLAPKYVARRGSGWDVLMSMIPSVLRDRVLFGTDWPVMPHQRVLDEWQAMGLDDAVLRQVLGANARSLYSRTPRQL